MFGDTWIILWKHMFALLGAKSLNIWIRTCFFYMRTPCLIFATFWIRKIINNRNKISTILNHTNLKKTLKFNLFIVRYIFSILSPDHITCLQHFLCSRIDLCNSFLLCIRQSSHVLYYLPPKTDFSVELVFPRIHNSYCTATILSSCPIYILKIEN